MLLLQVQVNGHLTTDSSVTKNNPYTPSSADSIPRINVFLANVAAVCGSGYVIGNVSYRLSTGVALH
jgi:hypothetical protein